MSLQINAQIARKIERYPSSPSSGFELFTMVKKSLKMLQNKEGILLSHVFVYWGCYFQIMSKETCSSSFWSGVGKIFGLAVWH